MNQDQVKQKLLQLKSDVPQFSLIFSGKTSKKAHGIYHPENQEIIIHNRNFNSDNALMYTAIHEFAHHVHVTNSPLPVSNRSHTVQFWSIFHQLLQRAEKLNIYINIFENEPEFIALTEKIKTEFLTRNGNLMREFGLVLVQAEVLCRKYEVSFTDYLDRALCIPRDSAKVIMKSHAYDVPPQIGYDNMRTIVSIPDQETRQLAEKAFLQGYSPDMVKFSYKTKPKAEEDEIEQLVSEKRSIKRRIESLTERLKEVEKRIAETEQKKAYTDGGIL